MTGETCQTPSGANPSGGTVMTQVEHKCARSATENTGRFTDNVLRERNGRYKTILCCW